VPRWASPSPVPANAAVAHFFGGGKGRDLGANDGSIFASADFRHLIRGLSGKRSVAIVCRIGSALGLFDSGKVLLHKTEYNALRVRLLNRFLSLSVS
jgi:hypothetical protein